jgi:hypothetical protein
VQTGQITSQKPLADGAGHTFLKVLQRHPHGCRRSSAGHLIELQQELQ